MSRDGKTTLPVWLRVAPFALSASFYLSLFLSILAPVPIVWVNLTQGRGWAFLATLCNGGLVWLAAGPGGLAGYLVFSLSTAWLMPEVARLMAGRRKGAQGRLFGVLWAGVIAVILGGVFGLLYSAWSDHVSPAAQVQRAMTWLGEQMSQQTPPGQWDPAEWAEHKEQWLRNLPSSLAIAALIQSWVILTLLMRLNPGKIRERLGVPAGYLRGWRTPEYWVWPTLVSGFGWIVFTGGVSDFCWNFLKFSMAIYALQGLAILGCVFDIWGLRGFVRGLGFFLVLSVMLPLLLALGFFDLWFDFRSKLRQS